MNAINKNEVSMSKEFFKGQILVDMRDNKSGLHKVEIGTSHLTKCVKIFSSDMSHSYWVYSGYYRVADKEEIKAGHRIDHISQEGNMVHDLGDDSHIENHISPLCKVEVK